APLPCDTPLPKTLTHAIDTDLLAFTAVDGERVHLSVLNGSPVGAGFNVDWRLLDSQGNPVTGGCGSFGFGTTRDCGPLTAAGSPYRLEVEDSGRNDTGTYVAYLQRLSAPCDATPFPCDTPLTRALSDPLDTDLLAFSV